MFFHMPDGVVFHTFDAAPVLNNWQAENSMPINGVTHSLVRFCGFTDFRGRYTWRGDDGFRWSGASQSDGILGGQAERFWSGLMRRGHLAPLPGCGAFWLAYRGWSQTSAFAPSSGGQANSSYHTTLRVEGEGSKGTRARVPFRCWHV